MFAARVPCAAASAVLLSLAAFFVLWRLVSVPMDPTQKRPVIDIEFTPQIVESPVVIERPDKPQRDPPRLEPQGPRSFDFVRDPTATPFRPEPISVPGPGREPPAMGIDRDVVPLVRINPDYPPRERLNGTEGWVRVRFTVTAGGAVRNAVVVASAPRAVFDEAALEAVARWRYNPRVEHGVAVERVGLEALFRFELEN